jgi:hypothetical protein
LLATEPERIEVRESGEVLTSLTAVAVEFACEEARRLGRAFTDNFLKIRRLIQDQSTYKMQIDIFTAFTAELLFPDHIIEDLEQLIEWKEDTSN